MGSADKHTYYYANRLIATVCGGATISHLASQEGYYDKVYSLMMSTDTSLIKECLWGLSNIVQDSEDSAYEFVTHEGLLNRVMVLM